MLVLLNEANDLPGHSQRRHPPLAHVVHKVRIADCLNAEARRRHFCRRQKHFDPVAEFLRCQHGER